MVRSMVSKALPFVLSLLVTAAHAQINCDIQTHYDQNGKICTTFTITPGQGSGPVFLVNSQDGIPSSVYPDFTPSISIGYFATWGQMFDPLKVLGIVSDGSLGNECLMFGTEFCTTVTNGHNPSQIVVAAGGEDTPSEWFEYQYTFTNLTTSNYGYVWNGTLNVTFRCFHFSARYGECSSFAVGSHTGDTLGVMEATPLQ